MPPARLPRPSCLKTGILAVLLALLGTSFAYDGFTLGVSGGMPGARIVGVRAIQPLSAAAGSAGSLRFAARADLAVPLSFDALPALGLAAVTSASVDGIERYLGLGGGMSMPAGEGLSPLWSVYGLAGFRMPITTGLFGALEVQLASNQLFTGPRINLAFEYTFGGRQ